MLDTHLWSEDVTSIGINTCQYCGCIHTGICSLVEEIEYFENGHVKKVKLKRE